MLNDPILPRSAVGKQQMLYRWLALLMVSSMVTGNGINEDQRSSTQPSFEVENVRVDCLRRVQRSRHSQALFMTGLFSMLDVLIPYYADARCACTRGTYHDEIRAAVMEGSNDHTLILSSLATHTSVVIPRSSRLFGTDVRAPIRCNYHGCIRKSLTQQRIDDDHRLLRVKVAAP